MCWSLGASSFFSVMAIVLAWKFKSAGWARVAFGYWSLMELIQALQYTVIDDCGGFFNYWLTIAAILHLSYQPFFYCIYLLHFLEKRNHVVGWGIVRVALVASTLLAARMIDMNPDDRYSCDPDIDPLCGRQVCSYSTKIHVAWIAPLRTCDAEYLSPGWSLHGLFWIAAPVAMGAWWVATYELLTGPILAAIISDDKNGTGAIWCMYATGQLLLVVLYNMRQKQNKANAKRAATLDAAEQSSLMGSHSDAPCDNCTEEYSCCGCMEVTERLAKNVQGPDGTDGLPAQNLRKWWFQTVCCCVLIVILLPLLRLANPPNPHSREPSMVMP